MTQDLASALDLARALKRRIAEPGPLFGTWLGIPHPTVVELMARCAFGFLLVDGEHASIRVDDLAALLPLADLHGTPVVFRPRSQSSADIKAALDAGAAGLMLPMVETVEEARAIVAAAKYAPLGRRGVGPWRASGYYDEFEAYLAEANRATTIIAQIESAAGLEAVEAIAAVEGIDVLFVGPADLATSLGVPIGSLEPPMLDAFHRVCRAAAANGKVAAIDLPSLEPLPRLREMGFALFTTGSDLDFIQRSGRALAADLARLSAGHQG